MKLSDIRTTAKEQLEKGKEIRDELDRRNVALETAQSERDSRYDDMASAMEVDEDFRPKGDILTANDAFEQSKEDLATAETEVEESESALEEINREKHETVDLLEEYAEERQGDRDRLQGASGSKFAENLKPLDEELSEHITEAEDIRDELLTSMDEGTGGRRQGGSFSSGTMEGTGSAAGMEALQEGTLDSMDVSDTAQQEISEEERQIREQIQKERSERYRQQIMNDPMTKNPLYSGVRRPEGAGTNCLTFGINDERLGKLSYNQGHNTLGWGEDCSLAQIANILTLSGRPTTEEEVVQHVNGIRKTLSSKPRVSILRPELNGGLIPTDISRVLSDFGLDNDVHLNGSGSGGSVSQLLGISPQMDLDQVAEAVEDGRGVILGVNCYFLNDIYRGSSANHAISVVGTARSPGTHEVMGFYINDTGHPDVLTDGRMERSQTKFIPRWRLDWAYSVPNSAAIITRNRIR